MASRCNHLDSYGEEQNIASTDMFWSEQMFPNPHGGYESLKITHHFQRQHEAYQQQTATREN